MTIWKFPLKVTDRQIVHMPSGAEILSVQAQGSTLCLWALVDPGHREVARVIRIYGTGHEVNDGDGMLYLGSAQMGSLVWHVFEDEGP